MNKNWPLRLSDGLSVHHELDELWDCRVTPQRLDHTKPGQPSDWMTGQDTRDRSFADPGLPRQDALIPTSDVDLTSELS